MRTINMVFSGSGVLETFFAVGLDTDPRDDQRRNDFSSKFSELEIFGRSLSSQSALRLREWIGAQRRVRREPSLGELTSAGVNNSQATLHALRSDRPTMTALCQGWLNTPALASLTPSESNVVSFKVNSKINCGEELC